MEILPPKYQKYRMFPQLQQNDENEQMQKALELASCSFFRQDYILFQTLSIFGRMDYRYQKYRI